MSRYDITSGKFLKNMSYQIFGKNKKEMKN